VKLPLMWLVCVAVSGHPPPSLFLEDAPPTVSSQNSALSKQPLPRSHQAKLNRAVLQQLGTDQEVSCRLTISGGEERIATVRKLKTSDERYRVFGGAFDGEAASQVLVVTDG